MTITPQTFFDFLNELTDFPETEDLQAWILPLFEQTAALHARNLVAPLDGVASLRFSFRQLWFEEALAQPPRSAAARVAAMDQPGVLEVSRRLLDSEDGITNLRLGKLEGADAALAEPAYLPGYISWEHGCGHHDPLTDIFVLGLVLASAACRLNFSDEADLARFVAERHNLFALNPRLNPVWARLIVRMTELSRHTREPDLQEVIHTLRNYRVLDTPASLAVPAGSSAEQRTRQLQAHLRDRLFEVSRRNKLLYFKTSQQTLNMTVGSFPLMLDVKNVTEQQLFYWHDDIARQLAGEQPIPLQKYLRFEDQPFLPAQLDAIRAAAQRDQTEYGFSQLRLAICMFRWHNFKEDKQERITTPLLLLPVTLTRKKGVRDTYVLQATTSIAEVNPVLRHVLRQVYGMELPESLDLSQDGLAAFHADIETQIRRSEPGITLHKVERPQIQLIRKQAKLRLDQYEKRRKKSVSGSARRSFGEFEYSYDKTAFHPLGLQIFHDRIKPMPAPLSDLVGPARPMFMSTPGMVEHAVVETGMVEKETYALDEERQRSPYDWEFDLCSITLGNFHYRKMSLVSDYNAILREQLQNATFDRLFSQEPRRHFDDAAAIPQVAQQFAVVQQDPTQARALVRASAGESMIIQGPPGTGKSQTITNLVADFVARGKRVMFVCEKRAAIDVVYHRLQQQGLAQLCALIHDSQGDKKAFIKDLKECYEGWLAPLAEPDRYEREREALAADIARNMALLADFSGRMTAAPAALGMPLRALYERIAVLNADVGPVVAFDAVLHEALPDYQAWQAHGPALLALAERLRQADADPVLSHYASRHLLPSLLAHQHPVAASRAAVAAALPALQQLHERLQALPAAVWASVGAVRALCAYLRAVAPLLRRQLPELLDASLPRSAAFQKQSKQYHQQEAEARAAHAKAAGWRTRPSPDEVAIALTQALPVEGKLLGFLQPAWWQLRRLFKQAYAMETHTVKPCWSDCLRWLQQDQQATAALQHSTASIAEEWHIDDLDAFALELDAAHRAGQALTPVLAQFQQDLASGQYRALDALLAIVQLGDTALRALDHAMVDTDAWSIASTLEQLQRVEKEAPWLPLLAPGLVTLSQAAPSFARAAREWDGAPSALELAIAQASLARLYRDDATLERQDGGQLDQLCARIGEQLRHLRALNASLILERRRNQFLANLALSNKSAAQLDAPQKEFKRRYTAGRRELENEFSKVMRFKAIRELASADSGLVVRDLKPVWMMSPLSISDTLPLEADYFDVVIFDEASQIPVEEAIPPLFRSSQVIVVGDEMQLPPTNFFATRGETEELDDDMLAELDSDSFLTQSTRNLPATMLEWHYRSRYEALINFSNYRFYDGRLLTIPDRTLAIPAAPIVVGADTDAAATLEQALRRPISFHYLPGGLYGERRNRPEAEYIAQLVHQLLTSGNPLSLGVVAFSEAQQDEIEQALQALARQDKPFSALLEAAYEREEDGQFCGLFVKNLENVQGDERDLIIMSVCYGYDSKRKMLMNFGPVNRAGGEKRLNVVFSRAKRHMFLVSSIKYDDIKNDYNPGAFALRTYLQYAECASVGDQAGARQVIDLLGGGQARRAAAGEANAIAEQIAAAMQAQGYLVDRGIGLSAMRCDLGVRRAGESAYRLGIVVDTAAHYAMPDLLERYLNQPELMKGAGWRLERVLGKDWVERRDEVLERLNSVIA